MTIILSMADYRKRRLPPVGYLDSAARRSDAECVRHDHLARVLEARRAADRAYLGGSPPSVSAGPAADPGPATDSIVERACDWCRRHTASIGIIIGAFLAGVAAVVIPRIGEWIVEVTR